MTDATTIISRPELTMPDREAAHLRAVYASAAVILEYGVGGSTIMASEMAGKTITSVETDQSWVETINSWVAQNPVKSVPDVILANI